MKWASTATPFTQPQSPPTQLDNSSQEAGREDDTQDVGLAGAPARLPVLRPQNAGWHQGQFITKLNNDVLIN